MPQNPLTLPDVSPIRQKLAGLRRGLRAWLALEGAAVLAILLLMMALASFAVDRLARMDRPQRAVCLAIIAVATAIAAFRRFLRPILFPLPDELLAKILESQRPELRERLISALEFTGHASPADSPELIEATVRSGIAASQEVSLEGLLDARRRRRNAAVLVAVAGAAIAIAALFPNAAHTWFARNILLADVAWPQSTQLELLDAVDGQIVCPRGDDLRLRVQADPDGVVPNVVVLQHRGSGAGGNEPMVLVGENEFHLTFRNVLEPFEFRFYGGDAVSEWRQVRLIDRPAVESLALTVTPPSYVPGGPQKLPAEVGAFPVLFGSRLEVTGRATKDLRAAQIAFGKEKPREIERLNARDFRVELSADSLRSGGYGVTLVDVDGYASRQPARFALKIVPDQKPLVRARLDGIGDMVCPRAIVPIHARVSDDFAVQSIELSHRLLLEGQKESPPAKTPFAVRRDQLGQKQIEATHRLDLEPLKPAVGAHLVLTVSAVDNDSVSGPKTGESAAMALRVVTEDELRAELLRREQEQRIEFERLLRDEQKLLENAKAALAKLRGKDQKLDAADRDSMIAGEKQQRQMAARAAAIADQFARILAEVENNRLEQDSKSVRERIQRGIIEPLERLGKRDMPAAADLAETAKKALIADLGPSSQKPIADLAARQEDIVAAMRDILRHMVKWEGYQEAVHLLRDLLKAQKDVNEETAKELERRVKQIFEK